MTGKSTMHPANGKKESGAKTARQAINLEQKLDVICQEI
jgi:hypothetical protein